MPEVSEGVRVYELAIDLRVEARDVVQALKVMGVPSPGHLTLVSRRQADTVTGVIDGVSELGDSPLFTLAVRVRRLEQRLAALEARP